METSTTTAQPPQPPPPPLSKLDLISPLPLSFSNGATPHLRKHHPEHHLYRECLRNHAASLGGHALDGCGEFMPSPSSSPSLPTSLTCAACGCHRNFHRRLFPTSASPSPSPSSSSEDDDPFAPHTLMALRSASDAPPRKRFRTRFSPEQKHHMHQLSERLGWRLQKRDDQLVEDCCRQIGVGKGVFKVWMHNNKQSLAPRPTSADAIGHLQPTATNGA